MAVYDTTIPPRAGRYSVLFPVVESRMTLFSKMMWEDARNLTFFGPTPSKIARPKIRSEGRLVAVQGIEPRTLRI